jgi:predicted RNase H-like HicB family nuclease
MQIAYADCYNRRYGEAKMEDELMRRHFPIIIEQDSDGVFIVDCPSFQGCRSYGDTIEEAMDNIREAIEACMEEMPVADDVKFIGVRDLEVNSA